VRPVAGRDKRGFARFEAPSPCPLGGHFVVRRRAPSSPRAGSHRPSAVARAARLGVGTICLAALAGTACAGAAARSPTARAAPSPASQAVGALVRPDVPGVPSCTGTLVGPDVVLTASHCLPPIERVAGSGCAARFVLGATSTTPGEVIDCAAVLFAVTLTSDDALEPDDALLRLARPASRAPASLDATPLALGATVTVVSITPHPVNAARRARDVRECRVASSDPHVRELGARAAQVGWLSGCSVLDGDSGSAAFDARGHLRAVVHGGAHGTVAVFTPVDVHLRAALARSARAEGGAIHARARQRAERP